MKLSITDEDRVPRIVRDRYQPRNGETLIELLARFGPEAAIDFNWNFDEVSLVFPRPENREEYDYRLEMLQNTVQKNLLKIAKTGLTPEQYLEKQAAAKVAKLEKQKKTLLEKKKRDIEYLNKQLEKLQRDIETAK